MSKIDVDRLSLEVMKILDAYKDVTVDIMKDAVERTAKETVAEVRRNIASSGIKDTGNPSYAKSWAKKRDKNLSGRYKYDMVVYSKPPKYRIAHLLEKGHDLKRAGKTLRTIRGFSHVKPGEDYAVEKLEQYIKEGIERKGGG